MFKNDLIVQATAPYKWKLFTSLEYLSNDGFLIIVPVGFISDLASIPRILHFLPHLDPNGRSRRAAVLHDYLYFTKQFNLKYSDQILKEALKKEGMNKFTANIYYYAVRLFGRFYWKSN